MTIELGKNILDGREIDVAVDDAGNTVVCFPFWVDPVSGQAFTVIYSPGVTITFIGVQVDALLHGQVPPFVGV